MRRLKTVRRPPIYPKSPGHLPCSSLTHPLPLPSRRPSVSFGGFGLRHIFYRMVTQNLVEKSDRGYQQLQKTSVDMRDSGALPYSWIEDSSRRAYMNTGYAGVGSFAEVAASIYRRDYWDSTDTFVEVWCESRSLAGVLGQVCREYVVLYSRRAALQACPSYSKPQDISETLDVLTPSSCTWATTTRRAS